MNNRFKPMLAVAVAAGAMPILDAVFLNGTAFGGTSTVGNFSFEGFTSPTGTSQANSTSTATTTGYANAASFSYAAEFGLATVTLSKSGPIGTATNNSTSYGSISAVGGNNSAKALTGNNLFGSSYTFSFTLDGLENIGLSFDMTGSNTGPRDFVVQYSLDGVTYSSVATFSIANVSFGGSASSNTAVSRSFALPTEFSDNAELTGELGFLRILQSGSAAISGTPGTAGTNRIDNVLITADAVAVPEPSASVMTLAAAALLAKRRGRKA